MNGAHLHLIVNHVSLFALAIGVIALAISMRRNSPDLRILASVLFVVAAVFGWVTVESGESAADIVKTLGGATDPFVNEHAEAGEWALRLSAVLAVLTVGMEWAVRKKRNWLKPLQWAVLILAIASFGVFARTAFLGGAIRHTEIRQ